MSSATQGQPDIVVRLNAPCRIGCSCLRCTDERSEAAGLIERLRADLREEKAIVDRIWAIFGNPSYESLQGKSIYDLIEGLRAALARKDAVLQRLVHAIDNDPLWADGRYSYELLAAARAEGERT